MDYIKDKEIIKNLIRNYLLSSNIENNNKLRKFEEYIEAIYNKNNIKSINISERCCQYYNKIFLSNKPPYFRPLYFILEQYNLKYCSTCNKIYNIKLFCSNKKNKNNINYMCKYCNNLFAKTRKKIIIERTPKWANLEKINQIYKNCPEGYHVDHIIPLRGKLVNGLHVENNLQYLLAKDNIKKSNKYYASLGEFG